jgi:Sulfotransferase family
VTRTASELPRAAPATGEPPLVLVGGLPRSGTSLMGKLLGSHSSVAVPPTELGFFERMFGTGFDPRRPMSGHAELERQLRRLHARKLHEWQLDEEALVAASHEVEPTYRALFVLVLDAYRRSVGKIWMGDKTTTYERWLGVLDEWFDDYRFVHMIRNPIDAFASLKWYPGREWDVALLPWIDDWNRSVTHALHRGHAMSGRYRCVRYEDLANDAPAELSRVCELLSLEFEPAMLRMEHYDYRDNSSFGRSAARREYVEAVRRADDVDRREGLSREELHTIVSLCGPLAYLAGYELGPLRRRRGSLGRLPYGRLPAKPALVFAAGRARQRLRRALRRV